MKFDDLGLTSPFTLKMLYEIRRFGIKEPLRSENNMKFDDSRLRRPFILKMLDEIGRFEVEEPLHSENIE